jgi:Flp pilus assembly protein TadD
MTRTLLRIATGAALLAVGTVACTPDGARVAAVSDVAPKAASQAAGYAARANAALVAKKRDDAIRLAEQAVALAPRDAGYRTLLGQAYLAVGRFQSAQTSFRDAVTLDPALGRATLNLALTQIVAGHAQDARTTLEAAQGKVPAADYGLALALAGDLEAAIPVLEGAARSIDSSPKARQNLALTYALAGRWAEAQTVAAQDVSPGELAARLSAWAKFAHPVGAADQVASLLGVVPVIDAGQPVQLALEPVADPAAPALAEAAPAFPAPIFPAPVAAAPSAEPVASQPVLVATQDIPQRAPATFVPQPSAPMKLAPVVSAASSAPVVQIGAFSSKLLVSSAWKQAVARTIAIKRYTPVSMAVNRGDKVLHRLAVSGFASRSEASRFCDRIRQDGGVCFVRSGALDTRLARTQLDGAMQLASR